MIWSSEMVIEELLKVLEPMEFAIQRKESNKLFVVPSVRVSKESMDKIVDYLMSIVSAITLEDVLNNHYTEREVEIRYLAEAAGNCQGFSFLVCPGVESCQN